MGRHQADLCWDQTIQGYQGALVVFGSRALQPIELVMHWMFAAHVESAGSPRYLVAVSLALELPPSRTMLGCLVGVGVRLETTMGPETLPVVVLAGVSA